jgi:periplasmic protein TonB
VTSQLLKPGRSNRTSRTTTIAAITAGHAVIILMGMYARGPVRDEEPVAPIAVSLLTEQQPEIPPPQLRPPEIVLPEVQVPLLQIDIQLDSPPPPIAVVARAEPPSPPSPPQPSAPAALPDNREPVMATSVEYVRPPVLVYPTAAKQARASGTVQVRAVVETDGRVREVKVDRSSGHASLDKAATDAMRAALFKPYMHNGIARAAVVIVPMDFGLKARSAKRDKDAAEERCGKLVQRDRIADSCAPDRGPPPLQILSQSIAE